MKENSQKGTTGTIGPVTIDDIDLQWYPSCVTAYTELQISRIVIWFSNYTRMKNPNNIVMYNVIWFSNHTYISRLKFLSKLNCCKF